MSNIHDLSLSMCTIENLSLLMSMYNIEDLQLTRMSNIHDLSLSKYTIEDLSLQMPTYNIEDLQLS